MAREPGVSDVKLGRLDQPGRAVCEKRGKPSHHERGLEQAQVARRRRRVEFRIAADLAYAQHLRRATRGEQKERAKRDQIADAGELAHVTLKIGLLVTLEPERR